MGEKLREKTVAFIDLGTNSARLFIVRLNSNYSYSVLRRQKETVRLGQGEFGRNILEESAIKRTVIVCRNFVETAKNFGAEEIIAVATSATRDAVNKEDFLRRIKKEADLSLEIISGAEEARLIYLGVSSGTDIGKDDFFFIDIGGGSTEIIVGDQSDCHFLKSLKLGAIRTSNKFFPEEFSEKVSRSQFDKIKRHVVEKYVHTKRDLKNYNIKGVIGSSGTIQSLVEIKNCMGPAGDNFSEKNIIGKDELLDVIIFLCDKTLEERRSVPGINTERADIIIAGGIILYTILDETGLKEIRASERSLRDGLLMDYLSKVPGFLQAGEVSVRKRSVRQLGRSCRIDEKHAGDVIRLSLDLFDSAKDAGIHSLGEHEREILDHSAYLHDIGQFISFSRHQNHSYYVITNAPLLGFNQNEIEMIGLITRYHRKKMPKKSDYKFKKMKKEDQKTIILLSLFLRMAEHMERSHDGRVKKASFKKTNGDIVLFLESEFKCTLELWSLEEDLLIFKNIFGKKAYVKIISSSF